MPHATARAPSGAVVLLPRPWGPNAIVTVVRPPLHGLLSLTTAMTLAYRPRAGTDRVDGFAVDVADGGAARWTFTVLSGVDAFEDDVGFEDGSGFEPFTGLAVPPVTGVPGTGAGRTPEWRSYSIPEENRYAPFIDERAEPIVLTNSPLDPAERKDYEIGFEREMNAIPDTLETVTVELSAAAIAAGVLLDEQVITTTDLVTLWLAVDPAYREAQMFEAGTTFELTVDARTRGGRRYRRTGQFRVQRL